MVEVVDVFDVDLTTLPSFGDVDVLLALCFGVFPGGLMPCLAFM